MAPSALLLTLPYISSALAYPTALSWFSWFSPPSAPPSSLVVRANTTPAGWTYVGCFKDSPTRVLSSKVSSTSTNTPTTCLALCSKSGYQYGGTEYGTECWCGNTLTSPVARPESDCNVPCSGDKTQTCGASYALSLYQLATAATTNSVFQGCYVDSNSRLLPSFTTRSSSMTPTLCKSTCVANGYQWYGVENGNECYCATNLSASAKKASSPSECSTACSGDSSLVCGASWRLTVYGPPTTPPLSFSTLPSTTPLGCYLDAGNRLLPYRFVSDDNMTPAMCRLNCMTYGYPYFVYQAMLLW
ncbi:hypothetical protein FRB90_012101 [Tulasnella sp. 427]|nr:hypothetical protein FRB90_012101 [Tulasnella sp. 427]